MKTIGAVTIDQQHQQYDFVTSCIYHIIVRLAKLLQNILLHDPVQTGFTWVQCTGEGVALLVQSGVKRRESSLGFEGCCHLIWDTTTRTPNTAWTKQIWTAPAALLLKIPVEVWLSSFSNRGIWFASKNLIHFRGRVRLCQTLPRIWLQQVGSQETHSSHQISSINSRLSSAGCWF